MFLPHDTDWTKVRDGTVFDAPDCELGHHGEDVSFNSILKKYKITDPALVLLGEIGARLIPIRRIRTPQEKVYAGLPVASERSGSPTTKSSNANLLSMTRCMPSANAEPTAEAFTRRWRYFRFLSYIFAEG